MFQNRQDMLMGSIQTAPSDVRVDAFWNLENIEITDSPWEKDDDQALKAFEKTVKIKDGRYEVGWP